MIEALQFDFMQNALAAGLLASIICGVIGTLVVVNRLVFLSGGIAHASYGGIGLAFYFKWPYLPGTIGFSSGCCHAHGVCQPYGQTPGRYHYWCDLGSWYGIRYYSAGSYTRL
jgi:ABC-type Mn2+/Zn2+ transport system permease subunit